VVVSFHESTYCTAEGYLHMRRLELAVSEIYRELEAAAVIIGVLLHYASPLKFN